MTMLSEPPLHEPQTNPTLRCSSGMEPRVASIPALAQRDDLIQKTWPGPVRGRRCQVVGTGPSCHWYSTQHYLTALRVSPAAGAMLHAAASAARGPACVTEQGAGGCCEGIAGSCSHRSWTRVWQKSQPAQLKQAHTDTPE